MRTLPIWPSGSQAMSVIWTTVELAADTCGTSRTAASRMRISCRGMLAMLIVRDPLWAYPPRVADSQAGKEKRPGPRARTPTGRQFVPPYEAFPLRWAGVSLLIVGLTSSLVSHLNGSDPAPGVEKHEERSTRSVECQGCGLGRVEPHPKTPCTFHDSSLRARTAEPGRHR